MKRTGVGLLVWVAVAMGAFASAQDDALAKRVDVHLTDADLHSATMALTKQTGIMFIFEGSNDNLNKITMNLSGVTAEDAIRYICRAAGASAERDQNGVFILRLGKEPEKAPPKQEQDVPKPVVLKKLKLTHADPKSVLQIITSGESGGDMGYFLREADAFGKGRSRSNPGVQLTVVRDAMITTPTATGEDVISLPETERANQYGGGGGSTVGGGNNRGGNNNNYGGGNNNNNRNGGGNNNRNGGGGSGSGGNFQDLVGRNDTFVPQGITRMSYDPLDNSIIVQGSEDAIKELERTIEMFDVAPQQVVVKVEFITTSNSSEKSLGIDWQYERGTVTAGSAPGIFARNGDPVYFNYSTGNVAARLRTVLTNGYGRTVNAPLLRTLNNQPAYVSNSTQTTIWLPNTNNGGGGITTYWTPQSITANTYLYIQPRINRDGTIAIGLSPQIQDLGEVRKGPDGSEVPDILTQSIGLVARVRNGETIALAGFTRKSTSFTQERFPILAELPIIGQLFRGRDGTESNQELIVFVTPTIVEDDQLGLGP